MKKISIILTTIIALVVVIISACQKENITPNGVSTVSSTKATKRVTERLRPITVRFGWSHVGCEGCAPLCIQSAGLCGMSMLTAPPQNGDSFARGGFDADGNLILVFVNYRNEPMFNGNDFTLEHDFTIPTDIAQALGGESYTIKARNYSIANSSNGKTVKFQKD